MAKLEKCEKFCNYHCSFDCPNAAIDEFEDRYDVPCEDIGMKRVKCNKCQYTDRNMTCMDCYFFNSDDCPEHMYDKIVRECVSSKQYPELGDNWKQELLDAIEKQVEGDS